MAWIQTYKDGERMSLSQVFKLNFWPHTLTQSHLYTHLTEQNPLTNLWSWRVLVVVPQFCLSPFFSRHLSTVTVIRLYFKGDLCFSLFLYIMLQCWMLLNVAKMSTDEYNIRSGDPCALNARFPTFFSTFSLSWHQLVTDFVVWSSAPLC